jgi:hypothetical protein
MSRMYATRVGEGIGVEIWGVKEVVIGVGIDAVFLCVCCDV